VKGLTEAQKNCFDPSSAALFAAVPKGLVLAPLFYGPTVLKLSQHSVVGGPYHRTARRSSTPSTPRTATRRGEGDHRCAPRRLRRRLLGVAGIGDRAHKAPDG